MTVSSGMASSAVRSTAVRSTAVRSTAVKEKETATADPKTFVGGIETSFQQVVTYLRDHCREGEHFTLELTAEQSQFTRFNRAKVRQTGTVADGNLELTLMANERRSFRSFPLTGDRFLDGDRITQALLSLRSELPQLPTDPYLVLPNGANSSRDVYTGTLLPSDHIATELLTPVADLDFAGIYAGGAVIRGYADSAGQLHWFATESFTLDYSMFTADGQAVKGTVAGRTWDEAAYHAKLTDSRQQLAQMDRVPQAIAPGAYRTYLAPTAVAQLTNMFSWAGVSEASLQKGDSALSRLRRGEATLSPQFVLKENFSQGLVPRFNDTGDVAPLCLTLIDQGQLQHSLISARTAKEYGLESNGAAGWEGLRSPEVSPGTLATRDILAALDTGLYISNLHYLNWSDRPTGRITGMTRYACFWVENGKIVAPIKNLRFDDSLYQFFGEQLVALTDQPEFIPKVGSYGQREIGGTWAPGILVNQFAYTL